MTNRRGFLARRTATEWGVRGLLAIATMWLGYASVAQTLAYGLRDSDPARAFALSSGDGRVVAQLAAKLSGPDATLADRSRADRLAQRALRQDATTVAAVSTLGINAQIRGDTPGARRLFVYAEALSRRDLQTQLWSIEDAVGRGNIPSALRHYDVALRTSRNAPSLLFPILAAAIAEPAVREALVATLAHRPAWSALFVENVAANGTDPAATQMLFRALRRKGFPISGLSQALLVNTLAARGMFADAWSYYETIRPGVDRRRSRDPSFTADLVNPTVYDWTLVNDAGISASFQRGKTGGTLDFSAPAGVGGTLLRQAQLLPPGNYRLEGHSVGIDQPEGSRPYWMISCGDGRELERVVLPNSAEESGMVVGRVTVPAACPVQTLVLIAQPSDAVSGVSGQIDRARLLPLR